MKEGGRRPLRLFIGVARTSVGRTLNVKPALSLMRFKGLVTARNHAVRVYTLSFSLESVEISASFYLELNLRSAITPTTTDTHDLFFITSLDFHESRYRNVTSMTITVFLNYNREIKFVNKIVKRSIL